MNFRRALNARLRPAAHLGRLCRGAWAIVLRHGGAVTARACGPFAARFSPGLRPRRLCIPGLSRRQQGRLLGWPRNPLRCCYPQRVLIVEARMPTSSLPHGAGRGPSFGALAWLPSFSRPRRFPMASRRRGRSCWGIEALAEPRGIRRGGSEGAPDHRLQSASPSRASRSACTPLAIRPWPSARRRPRRAWRGRACCRTSPARCQPRRRATGFMLKASYRHPAPRRAPPAAGHTGCPPGP